MEEGGSRDLILVARPGNMVLYQDANVLLPGTEPGLRQFKQKAIEKQNTCI